jgi:hypothetical protein
MLIGQVTCSLVSLSKCNAGRSTKKHIYRLRSNGRRAKPKMMGEGSGEIGTIQLENRFTITTDAD